MDIRYLVHADREQAKEWLIKYDPFLKIYTTIETGEVIMTTLDPSDDEVDPFEDVFTEEQMTELLVQSHLKRVKELSL